MVASSLYTGADDERLPVPTATGPGSPHWVETLNDGTAVLIRPIGKSDIALERAFIEHLSPEAKHFRFFGQFRAPSAEQLARFCDIDPKREAAFVALVNEEGRRREIGVSRYSIAGDGKACEAAVVVADAWQRRGLGVALMKHLMAHARARGLRTMYSIDLAENAAMQGLAHFLGFSRRPDPDDAAQVIHTIAL